MPHDQDESTVTLWMRPSAMVKEALPSITGSLVVVLLFGYAGGDWQYGLVLGTALGCLLVCASSRAQLTPTTLTQRRLFSRASRRWVDLALQPEARDVRFILFDQKEDDPGRAWRAFVPANYERDWRRGRIGALVQQHSPELLDQADHRGPSRGTLRP